jgi:predicted PurR-regulated permease PerM
VLSVAPKDNGSNPKEAASKPKESVPTRHAGWVDHDWSLEARDPTPFRDATNFWRATAQAATIVMCVLMLGVLLYLARALILPLLCAFSVGLTLGPVIKVAERRGIPPWVMAIVLVVLLIAGVNLAIVLLAGPVSALVAQAPEIGSAFVGKLHIFDRSFAALNELQTALGINTNVKSMCFDAAAIITGFVTVVTPAALQFSLAVMLFFATLFFFILGRASFRSHTINWFSDRDARLRALKIMNDIESNLGGYLIVVTAINLCLGIVTTLMAYALGLPSPILWGAFAFVLNYVPYVGPAIMDVLLFGVGLLTFPTLLGALLPPAIFLAITIVEGQFLTPAIVGRRVLNLHPLAVFLSIAFWAWLWGPVGAFLATPILIMGRVAVSHLYPSQKADLPG